MFFLGKLILKIGAADSSHDSVWLAYLPRDDLKFFRIYFRWWRVNRLNRHKTRDNFPLLTAACELVHRKPISHNIGFRFSQLIFSHRHLTLLGSFVLKQKRIIWCEQKRAKLLKIIHSSLNLVICLRYFWCGKILSISVSYYIFLAMGLDVLW